MSVQVGSQVYLKSDDFHLQYYQLLDEIAAVVNCISAYEEGNPSEDTVLETRRYRQSLSESWPIPDDPPSANDDQPVQALIIWMDMIVRRTTHLLTMNLKKVIH